MARKLIYLSMLVILLAASPFSALAKPLSLSQAGPQQPGVIPAASATLTVNTAFDENDGSCADGDCSLRDAIALANPGDTINFANDYTIILGSTLVVSTNLTIDGGAQSVTVSGNDTVRVFSIYTGTLVTIDSLTIAHGSATIPEYGSHPAGGGMKIGPGAVVTLTHSAVISNTATYYDAEWDEYLGHGGGVYNMGALKVISTAFSDNVASSRTGYVSGDGGAIYNRGTLVVTASTLTGNAAEMGGAIYSRSGATLTVESSTISNNSAPCGGAGISSRGTATVSGSTISNNVVPGEWCEGDAAGIGNRGTMTVTHSIISGNVSEGYYGGMSNYEGTLTVIDSEIFNNVAGAHGGGIYNWWGAHLTVINTEIYSNTAVWWGGGIFSGPDGGASLTLVNSAVYGNQAEKGGGIFNGSPYNDSFAALTMINSTVFSNTASLEGGGIYNKQATPTLSNSIIWGNAAATGPQIYNINTLKPTIHYSDIEGCGGSGALWDTNLGVDGGGNLDSNPLFVDADGADNIIGTGDDDLRLADGSPAIDAADNSVVLADIYDLDGDGNTTEPLPYDLDDAERFQNNIAADTGNGAAPIVDIGAYEAPKVVNAGTDQSATEGDLVAFSAATAFTAVESISWDFGDGSGASGALNPTHTYLDNGVYTVMLIITDTLHGVAWDSLLVTVANADPVLGALGNQTTPEDTPLDISVAFTDPGVLDTHTAQINWGDGSITAGAVDPLHGLVTGNHTYAAPGTYTLTLTITDDDGGTDTLIIEIAVTPNYKLYFPLTFHH